jgi:hypothetical protein
VSASFTPGPWRVHTYNAGHLLGYIQGAPMPGQRYGEAIVLKLARPTSERSKADARLIAAAPTMYAALVAVRARYQHFRLTDDDQMVMDRVQAALEVASGIETGTAKTEGLGPKDESPTAESGDAQDPSALIGSAGQ